MAQRSKKSLLDRIVGTARDFAERDVMEYRQRIGLSPP